MSKKEKGNKNKQKAKPKTKKVYKATPRSDDITVINFYSFLPSPTITCRLGYPDHLWWSRTRGEHAHSPA